MTTTLGMRIQALRKQHGLSQEELAERVGVSRQAVSKWEVDAAVPETDKLLALAKALGVSVDALLGNETPPPPGARRGTDAFAPLVSLVKRRGYRAGYVLMGWGLFVLLAGGLVGYAWYRMSMAPLITFGASLDELSPILQVPLMMLGVIGIIGLAAVIGGIIVVVRGRKNLKE